jgi:hypothetical protein
MNIPLVINNETFQVSKNLVAFYETYEGKPFIPGKISEFNGRTVVCDEIEVNEIGEPIKVYCINILPPQ